MISEDRIAEIIKEYEQSKAGWYIAADGAIKQACQEQEKATLREIAELIDKNKSAYPQDDHDTNMAYHELDYLANQLRARAGE